jgi:hypothetical protein
LPDTDMCQQQNKKSGSPWNSSQVARDSGSHRTPLHRWTFHLTLGLTFDSWIASPNP